MSFYHCNWRGKRLFDGPGIQVDTQSRTLGQIPLAVEHFHFRDGQFGAKEGGEEILMKELRIGTGRSSGGKMARGRNREAGLPGVRNTIKSALGGQTRTARVGASQP